MLEVRKLRKVYDGASRTVEAIRDVNFCVGQGELVCIVGPSGAGKTTLLKCIAGLLAPTSGAVILEGHPVVGPPPAMAVVFQEYGRSLFPWLTVHDNVALPLKQKKMTAERREDLVRNALAAVDLANVHSAYPWQLSGGMQQRVAIARAVAYEPHVLLMDEPFAAVDAQTRADLEDLIRVLWHKLRVTVLFVTHDIDEFGLSRPARSGHVACADRDHGRRGDRSARRPQPARDAVAGALRRVAQAHLCANSARQAGLAPTWGLIRPFKHSSHVKIGMYACSGGQAVPNHRSKRVASQEFRLQSHSAFIAAS